MWPIEFLEIVLKYSNDSEAITADFFKTNFCLLLENIKFGSL